MSTAGDVFDIPHIDKRMPPADYGCALSHREAWKRLINSTHQFAVVLEDDGLPFTKAGVLEFPPIPTFCDWTLLSTQTSGPGAQIEVCGQKEIFKLSYAFSTAGYIIHRKAAQKLLKDSQNGCVLL